MKLKILILIVLLLTGGCKEVKIRDMALTLTIQDGAVQLSGNPIWIKVHTSGSTGTNYKLLLQVTSLDGELAGGPFVPDAIPHDVNGDAWFNISGLVNLPVDYEFEYPAVNVSVKHDMLALNIALDIGETYIDANDNLQESWEGLTGNEYKIVVLKGGISNRKLAEYTAAETNFFTEVVATEQFLTNQPATVKISPATPGKLWYVSQNPEQETLTLHVNVYWLPLKLASMCNVPVTIDPGALYEFNVQANLLGFELHPTGMYCSSFMVQLKREGMAIGKAVEFVLDWNYYEQETNVYYANSIGGVDCLWCSGKMRQLFSTKTETAQRPMQRVPDPKVETVTVTNKTGQRKWAINTGFKSKVELAALADFLLAKKMWLLSGSNLIPVYLEDKEQALEDITGDITIDNFDFVLLEGHEDSYF